MSDVPIEIYAHRDKLHARTTERERNRAAAYIRRRRAQLETLQQAERLRAAGAAHAAAVFGPGYSGLGGNKSTEGKPRILYPKERKRPRSHLKEIFFTRAQFRQVALEEEVLVPIRLDFDSEKYKLRDTFTWNLNDHTIPIGLFADHLCEDYQLPPAPFVESIKRSIAEQLNDFHPHKFPEHAQQTSVVSDDSYTSHRDDDLRIPIKLDITIGRLNLVDQFEWDINAEYNQPEHFAQTTCLELGLAQEFQTAIAHAIREQCQLYTKSLFLVGHTFDGLAVADSDMRHALMDSLNGDVQRPKHLLDDFAPILSQLLPDQLERVEKEREREVRRNRRQTRTKRGPNLPDLNDLPKTYRTPYHNSVLIPEDERTANKFGILRDAVTGTMEEADGSEDDDILDDASLRDVGERSTRSARHQRGLTSAHSNPGVSPQQASSQRSGNALKGHQAQGVSSPYATGSGRSIIEPARPQRLLAASARIAFSEERSRATSASPSFLVKLRVPRLREFLAQQGMRASQNQLNGLRGYAQHLQEHRHPHASPHLEASKDLPLWLVKRLQALQESYPRDRFEPVIRPAGADGDRQGPGVSVRCLHCAGAMLSLNDFDKHLQSRDHRFRVDA